LLDVLDPSQPRAEGYLINVEVYQPKRAKEALQLG
jgi:hypothetical protein